MLTLTVSFPTKTQVVDVSGHISSTEMTHQLSRCQLPKKTAKNIAPPPTSLAKRAPSDPCTQLGSQTDSALAWSWYDVERHAPIEHIQDGSQNRFHGEKLRVTAGDTQRAHFSTDGAAVTYDTRSA